MKANPPSLRRNRFVIVATIIVIFIVAGMLVVFFRALGGDEPAPASLTSGQATTSAAAQTSC